MGLRDLHEACKEQVEFLHVYIREAHPTDGWYIGRHDFRDPRSLEERRELARKCLAAMRHGIPTCVDDMDDGAMKAYAAWPDRLYLVGVDGRVRFAGERGPGGFRLDKLKAAMDDLSRA